MLKQSTSTATSQALLNVMEDLEAAKTVIELERAKDEAMLASIGDGLVIVDKEMRVTYVNHAAEEATGWKNHEIRGKVWQDVIQLKTEDRQPVPANETPLFLAIHNRKKTTATTFLYTKKSRRSFPVAITVAPVNLKRKIIGAIIVFRDVTHEKEVDKAKSEFVSLASHQLRTPLGIIKWYLEALENDALFDNLPPSIKQYFDEIYKNNERILNLVRGLLSVSRIEQGRVKNTPELVDIYQIIKEVVEQMRIIADKKGVTLRLDIPNQEKLFINIDVLRIHEVLENLIVNAIEYTPAKGLVEVIVNTAGDSLLISVKDTGIGISAQDQKKLFEKFFRAENAIGYNPEGTGLGLYIVKSYVEGWGGKIAITSEEGKGTALTMSLPLNQK